MTGRPAGDLTPRGRVVAFLALLGLGLALRLPLLPQPGIAGDLDDFATWAGAIATQGLGTGYDRPLSFPPVLPWIWAALGSIVPTIAAATDASDPIVRVALKLPASLADLGIAAGIGYALRARPRVALAAVAATVLHPATAYLSAWWGQFESLYVLPVVVAYVLAVRGRTSAASVAMAVALMTKPQALPLLVPFVAWVVGRTGWRGSVRPGIAGALTIVALWAPFLAAGGPARYLESLRAYSEIFGVISLRAWNPWWVIQSAIGGPGLISDANPIVGPLSFRLIGVAAALLLGALIAVRVARRPTPESLAWGLVAATLAAVCALTTMHERYAYPALVLLPLLWPDRRAFGLWAVLSVAFTLNLVAAAPPGGPPGSLIPIDGSLGLAGSLALTGSLIVALVGLRTASLGRGATSGP